MGRRRAFDVDAAVEAAAELFARRAYDGVSIDDLVTRLEVHRNSLYGVFGSKRGLYLAALRRHVELDVRPQLTRMAQAEEVSAWDLLLVAAVDRAADDPDVADLVLSVFAELDEVTRDPGVTEALLGKWLRGRAEIGHRRAVASEGGGPVINDAPETAPREEM